MERKWKIELNVMKEPKKILKGLACSAAIGLALAAGSARATDYEIIRLLPNDPNANYSMLHSINNDGEILGTYGELGDEIGRDGYPLLWAQNFLYKEGIFKDLNILLGNYRKDVINDLGEILARNPDSPGSSSGVYMIDGVVGLNFWGSDLNNKGEVCGYHGYLYRGGETIELPLFYARAINDNSQVAGEILPGDPALWEEGIVTVLETPLYTHARAYDINNNGIIVGHLIDGPKKWACFWENGQITKIETRSDAFSINDKGEIVGGESAFLYDNGKMIYLNDFLSEDSEWENLVRATNINNRGQITGYGYLKEYSHHNYIGFLANPIQKTKTLSADSNDDGIVNGLDLADLGNQWLEKEDWYEE
ncbi:MAG: hypothetical protein KAY65_13445 [Planctomycetes bacterium]|nr:hypothetical protein [Planctomycetota bacterium]